MYIIIGYVTTAYTTNSMVYNFKVAQITKQRIKNHDPANPFYFISLLFYQSGKLYQGCTSEQYLGDLTAFVYNFNPTSYFRIDVGLANVQQKIDHKTTWNGTETDDILYTVGHIFTPNKKNNITVSGLLGIPTHEIEILKQPSFGYGQIGTGLQVDGLYKIGMSNEKHNDAWELGTGINFSINEVYRIFKETFSNAECIYLPDQKGNYRETLRENNDAIYRLGWNPSDKLKQYIQSL